MPYTPENNPYIPGDPYSYDLKWLVDHVKQAIALYQPLHDEFEAISQQFDDLYDYVHDYLDNLDFPGEISAVLNEWLNDGTLNSIIHDAYDDYIDTYLAGKTAQQDSRIEAVEDDVDLVNARVSQMVAENTTNLTGWDVVDEFEIVTISGGIATYTWTGIPDNSVMLEAAYNEDVNNNPWITGDIQVFYEALNHRVTVSKANLSGASCALKISYAYPDPVQINELEDIRVGANGITYATAGDAVRDQIDNLTADWSIDVPSSYPQWRQGWWGASSGAYDQNHNNAVCSDFIPPNVQKAIISNSYKVRLQAWENQQYKGIYNGSTYVNTNPNYFLNAIDFDALRSINPGYHFRLVFYAANGTDPVLPADALAEVTFITSLVDTLSDVKSAIGYLNIFDPDAFYTAVDASDNPSAYSYYPTSGGFIVDAGYTQRGKITYVDNNTTLQPGRYILSAYVTVGSGDEIFLDFYGSHSGYKLKNDRQGLTDANTNAGWVLATADLTSASELRFAIQPPTNAAGPAAISYIMVVAGNVLPDYASHSESTTAIDKYARQLITAENSLFSNFVKGEKIILKEQGYTVSGLPYALPAPNDYGKTARQDFDIYDDTLFQLMSDDYVVLVNINTGSVIAHYSIDCGHGNSCQFSKFKDNPSDDFPPLYCFDYSSNTVYKNHVTISGATLLATYTLSGVSGYRFSGGYDSDNNLLITLNYAQNSSTDATNNYMIFAAWDMNNLTDNGNGTYSPALIRSRNLPFIPTVQGCAVFNNRLYVVSGYYPSYSFPVRLDVFDYNGIKTSYIDDFPNAIAHSEGEAIAFYKSDEQYRCYFATYNPYIITFE